MSTQIIDSRSFEVICNIIENNRGNGIKIENSITPVKVSGGKIRFNKDLAIAVEGDMQKCLKLDAKPGSSIDLRGQVKEVKYGVVIDEESSACRLI